MPLPTIPGVAGATLATGNVSLVEPSCTACTVPNGDHEYVCTTYYKPMEPPKSSPADGNLVGAKVTSYVTGTTEN